MEGVIRCKNWQKSKHLHCNQQTSDVLILILCLIYPRNEFKAGKLKELSYHPSYRASINLSAYIGDSRSIFMNKD
jgi:hypothetical protein